MRSEAVWHQWLRVKYVFFGQRYHGLPNGQTEKAGANLPNRIEGQKTARWDTEADVIEREPSSLQKPRWINGVLLCAKASTVLLLLNIIFIAVAAGLSSRNAENSAFSSAQIVYQGSCVLSKRWNIALHLIINILSTGILGASNYCMQSLVAPSREEIDKYHARGRWLDIGCSSVRNLFLIGRSRLALWLVLLVTATPFHLLYNAIIFESVAINELDFVVGPGDLNSSNIATLKTPTLDQCFSITPRYPGGDAAVYRGANVDTDDISDSYWSNISADGYSEGEMKWHDFASDIGRGDYERLDVQQCFNLYSFGSNGGARVVVVLTNELSASQGGNTAILSTTVSGSLAESDTRLTHQVKGFEFAGKTLMINILNSGRAHYYTNQNFTQKACLDSLDITSCSDANDLFNWLKLDADQPTVERVNQYIQANTTSDIVASGYVITCDDTSMNKSKRYSIDGCLVIKSKERCQLLYSPPICIIIALTTFLKVIAMFLAARISRHRSAPLLTVGDAVASFMEKPDSTTEGICWLSNADVRRGAWKVPQKSEDPAGEPLARVGEREPKVYKRLSRRKRWMQASSLSRWITTLVLCIACIAVGAFLFEQAIIPLGTPWLTTSTLHSLWNEAFSDAIGYTRFVDLKRSLSTLSSVVIANIPQLVITVSYFFYNSVLTSMLATAEYSSYGESSKPLRVTWPVKDSEQQSTYWLSMPYQYGVPLMVIYMVLHWLISQSVFYVRIIAYDWIDRPIYQYSVSSMGYNSLAIFVSILVGGFMVCLLLGLSFRRFKSEMPLAGACSAAISAACHVPRDEDLNNAVRGPVMWGETLASPPWSVNFGGIEDGNGHCSFTSLETVRPSLSKMYA
ncbi:uncharacterized protein N7479_008193 [Penicillium vulpinum]|uniref:DUF6536 domain-containing protein n=1 Tax=Penicillium vulpinum TaxID=29845 RepID=A0A1V6RJN6_9EURO|nr:uncharacterized protein N7479_008193 [Penicillium vulpinum]KAJ5961043.1 hypothetical protein N7479_008193 [Penicillium vulpinum]OQE01750.1 hypothetical protein PENVUL_c041G06162 [Penicillium vulpinum]